MARRSNASADAPTPRRDHPAQILVLHGPEEMIKREALDELKDSIHAAHGETEIFLYDGKTAPLADVLDELRTFSMMGRHKIVIVDEGDAFVTTHREALERYAQAPVDNATLVLRSVKWNKGNLDKLIEKVGQVRKCESLSPGDARDWLVRRAQEFHAARIDAKAANLLVERMGSHLMQLDTELAKLAVLAGPGVAINTELVEQVVGRSSDEEAWAVQEAVLEVLASRAPAQLPGEGSAATSVIEKVHEVVDLAGQPDVLVAYFIADLMRKLHTAAMMKRQGAPEGQIARDMRLWGRRQVTFMQVLGRLRPAATGRLLDRIVELDVRAKTGRGQTLRNLECFCALLGEAV